MDRSTVVWALVCAALFHGAGTGPVCAGDVRGAVFDEHPDHRFPTCTAVIDVTKPPYSAKGDGTTDDTASIQQALHDLMGQHRILYFPNGTYLVSKTLMWAKANSAGQEAWGFNWIQGQSAAGTVIRLADRTFTDRQSPGAIMWCGGFGSADWFHNYIQDLTLDVGNGNPAASGLQFFSNNTGALRDLCIVSQDGQGIAGLDLAHRDMNGPLFVQNLQVRGFDVGVRTGNAVNSQTFEGLTLEAQNRVGFENTGQAVAIRRLRSENSVIAVSSYGMLSLLEARLSGRGKAQELPAVVNFNGGRMAIRDVETTGYARAIADVSTPDFAAALRVRGDDPPGSLGPQVVEYFSHAPLSPFGGPGQSLRLRIEEPPRIPRDEPDRWANVDAFGADPAGKRDSAAAIQRAIDSGAATIFFPGSYQLESPVIVRGKACRLLGVGQWIDYHKQAPVDFIIAEGAAPTVEIEHFAPINGGLEIQGRSTVIVRSVECRTIRHRGTGRLFLEDVATDDLRVSPGQHVWARQLNIENEGNHLTNDGGDVWVLGYKTERGGTLLETRGGGRSEVFGTFSYTTTAGKLAPMFVTIDASAFAFFSEVCFTGDPFVTLVRETRGGTVREVPRGDRLPTPYIGLPPGKSP